MVGTDLIGPNVAVIDSSHSIELTLNHSSSVCQRNDHVIKEVEQSGAQCCVGKHVFTCHGVSAMTIERDERAPRLERDERAREVIGGTVAEGDLHDGEMARTHVN